MLIIYQTSVMFLLFQSFFLGLLHLFLNFVELQNFSFVSLLSWFFKLLQKISHSSYSTSMSQRYFKNNRIIWTHSLSSPTSPSSCIPYFINVLINKVLLSTILELYSQSSFLDSEEIKIHDTCSTLAMYLEYSRYSIK